MRTENVSNDTLKSTTIKSSFQDIGLGNQLFNVGSNSQSFDQILSQQSVSQTASVSNQKREAIDSASKKATSQAQSGKTLPADDRRQRLENRQDKLAVQDKQRQGAAAKQERADAIAERKEAAEVATAERAERAEQAEPMAAADKAAAPDVDAESVADEKGGDDNSVDGEVVVAASETSNDVQVTESVTAESEAVEVESAPSADAVVAVETADARTDIEIEVDAELATVTKSADGQIASESKVKDENVKADKVVDAAALIDEVLSTAPLAKPAVEAESSVEDEGAASLVSSGASASPMMMQTDTMKPATEAQNAVESDTAKTVQLTEKNSQIHSNQQQNQSGERTDASSTALMEGTDAETDLLNGGGEKLTDALDVLKMEPGKANKAPVGSEQIATPVQERLAALAKSMEKPSKESSTSQPRNTTDVIDSAKGSSFQRNVDQFSRLQASAAKPLTTSIATPMNQKEWAGEMGQRLVMMVSSKIQSAQIQVTPGDMGPIDVKVSMQKDQAHVVFTSHVPQTRDALEQALPKLREMMDQNGVAMGNVDVRDQGTHQSSQRHGQEQQQRQTGTEDNSVASTDAAAEKVSVQQLGVVDYYA